MVVTSLDFLYQSYNVTNIEYVALKRNVKSENETKGHFTNHAKSTDLTEKRCNVFG